MTLPPPRISTIPQMNIMDSPEMKKLRETQRKVSQTAMRVVSLCRAPSAYPPKT